MSDGTGVNLRGAESARSAFVSATNSDAGKRGPVKSEVLTSDEAKNKLRCGSTNSDQTDADRHHQHRLYNQRSADAACDSPPPTNSHKLHVSSGTATSSRTFNVSFSEPLELELAETSGENESRDDTHPPALIESESREDDPTSEPKRGRGEDDADSRSSELTDDDGAAHRHREPSSERRFSVEGAPPSAFAFQRSVSSRAHRDRDRALYRSPSFTALSNREPSLAGFSHRDGFLREPSFAAFSIRDETVWRIALEVSLPFLFAGFGMVAAGVLLDKVQFWPFFDKVDQAMIMVPALLGLKGNLEMTLASRMSTQANMGKARETSTWWRIALANLVLTQAQALIVGFLAALVAMLLCVVKPGSTGLSSFKGETLLLLVASAVCTTSLASLLLGTIIILLITFSKRYKCNPDIIALPIAASLGDFTTLGFLALIGQGFYSAQPSGFWLLPTMSGILLSLIPLWLVLAYRSEHTRRVVSTGWLPIILAMTMSSCAGLVLDGVSEKFKNLAVFQPVVNGIAGNLAGIQASNLSTRLHQLFEEPGCTTSRFAAARFKSDRISYNDEPSNGSRRRRRRIGSPHEDNEHDHGHGHGHGHRDQANVPQVIELDSPSSRQQSCSPNLESTSGRATRPTDLPSNGLLGFGMAMSTSLSAELTPQNGTTTTSIVNGNGIITPDDDPLTPGVPGPGIACISAAVEVEAEPNSNTNANTSVNVTLPLDECDEHHSSRPPSPPPSLAAISFRRQRSMSAAWSTLTSAWMDDRGLLVRGCCPNPYHTFCGPRMHARTSRVLLYLAIPGHFIFMVLTYLVEYVGEAFYSLLFTASYLIAVFVQIMMILYLTHWLVQFLWKRGNDPDNFAIPYLTATGDILGSLVLAGVFYLVYAVTPADPITRLKEHGTDSLLGAMANFSTGLPDLNFTATANWSLAAYSTVPSF